jgi:very-short-patch-repair endonuclease
MMEGDDPLTLSRMERRFLQLLEKDGRELPATNERVGNHLVDCRWPHLHLTVELDSYRFHGSRRAWERDRRRDREARLRGDELLRYVPADVFEQPGPMLEELRERIPPAPRRRRRANPS